MLFSSDQLGRFHLTEDDVLTGTGEEVMELQEFFEYMEQHRATVVETAAKRYHSLTPLLGKVRYNKVAIAVATALPAAVNAGKQNYP
jgi:hypothetical protein